MMVPTARAARGFPAIRARSPYVTTRPGGIRPSADSTRRANGETLSVRDRIGEDASVGVRECDACQPGKGWRNILRCRRRKIGAGLNPRAHEHDRYSLVVTPRRAMRRSRGVDDPVGFGHDDEVAAAAGHVA